jgi:hypothetical protein
MPFHMLHCGIQRQGRSALGIKTDALIHSYVWIVAFIGESAKSDCRR